MNRQPQTSESIAVHHGDTNLVEAMQAYRDQHGRPLLAASAERAVLLVFLRHGG